jgi:hypothetical protein
VCVRERESEREVRSTYSCETKWSQVGDIPFLRALNIQLVRGLK